MDFGKNQNLFVGFVLWSFVILSAIFGAVLMSGSGDIVVAVATVVAAFVSGAFIFGAAAIAWFSVQKQIAAPQAADAKRFQQAITAELMAFSLAVIRAASDWNDRARQNANAVPTYWPVLPGPYVYLALVSLLGTVDPPTAASLVTFYSNVLDLNELSKESMQGRPSRGENVGTIAGRFRTMALSLADALEALNPGRRFGMAGHDLNVLFMPNGATVATIAPVPATLQELLRAIGR
jgi:hypothetical protein